jgi:hypothetical protein
MLTSATLELYYLAVVILKSRPTDRSEQQGKNPSSSLQSFCASSIVSIASEEFKHAITFWPVLPYAVSLALSVAYQDLRKSSISYKRKRAYATFQSSCNILNELSKAFLSARTMARMAIDTLREVEKVAVGRNRTHELARRRGIENRSDISEHQVRNENHTSNGSTRFEDLQDRSHPEGDAELSTALSASTVGPTTIDTISSDPTGFDLDMHIPADLVGDASLFSNFDPSFDLDKADALFSVNLNPTYTLFSDDWTI